MPPEHAPATSGAHGRQRQHARIRASEHAGKWRRTMRHRYSRACTHDANAKDTCTTSLRSLKLNKDASSLKARPFN
eukprot:6214818-Pleurochrysis_carterae.AAC.8